MEKCVYMGDIGTMKTFSAVSVQCVKTFKFNQRQGFIIIRTRVYMKGGCLFVVQRRHIDNLYGLIYLANSSCYLSTCLFYQKDHVTDRRYGTCKYMIWLTIFAMHGDGIFVNY